MRRTFLLVLTFAPCAVFGVMGDARAEILRWFETNRFVSASSEKIEPDVRATVPEWATALEKAPVVVFAGRAEDFPAEAVRVRLHVRLRR